MENKVQKKKQMKPTNDYLCSRTCGSGCTFPHVLQGPNSQTYTGSCS